MGDGAFFFWGDYKVSIDILKNVGRVFCYYLKKESFDSWVIER